MIMTPATSTALCRITCVPSRSRLKVSQSRGQIKTLSPPYLASRVAMSLRRSKWFQRSVRKSQLLRKSTRKTSQRTVTPQTLILPCPCPTLIRTRIRKPQALPGRDSQMHYLTQLITPRKSALPSVHRHSKVSQIYMPDRIKIAVRKKSQVRQKRAKRLLWCILVIQRVTILILRRVSHWL